MLRAVEGHDAIEHKRAGARTVQSLYGREVRVKRTLVKLGTSGLVGVAERKVNVIR